MLYLLRRARRFVANLGLILREALAVGIPFFLARILVFAR